MESFTLHLQGWKSIIASFKGLFWILGETVNRV